MNLVDSSGWLDYLADGTHAKKLGAILKGTDQLIVSVINLYEVFKVVARESGEQAALEVYGIMQKSRVVNLTSELTLAAVKIGIAEKIPFADSIILATVRSANATLWTLDSHFKGIKGVNYLPK